jgi:imidazolonepropionase-like amidohydrolase
MTQRHGARVRGAGPVMLLMAALLVPAPAAAQFVEPPPPAAYALQNVTLVRADGTRLTGQTLVVRAGRIEAAGTGIAVPADARVLNGDSLFVYPGLIDGAGMVKFEFPRDTTNRAQVRSWDPPRVVQGFLPSRRVVDHLAATGADGAELRKRGVVAVAVHPGLTEPLMPGRGVFVVLRRDAATPQQLLVDPVLAPLLTWRGGRGVYPATGMAVLNWYRQTFLDAQRQAQLAQLARTDPRTIAPPAFDPDYAVVQELLGGSRRVFFAANDAEEIRRVLRLAEEFRLRPVIVGGGEAWRVAAELRARDVPVLVNVDFPNPRRWRPDAPTDTAAAEPAPAVVREQRQFQDLYANAARLAEAGVTFALVSGGRGDLRAGVRRAMEYGLTEAAALRALTTTPAAIYGAPHLARIEPGLPATFIVADAPLFERDARILYTFVEGALEPGAEPRSRAEAAAGTTPTAGDAPAGDIVQVAGTWTVDVTGELAQTFTMRLTQEGTTLTGTLDGAMGSLPVTGSMDGTRITLNATLVLGGQSIPLTFAGEVRGDEASGTLDTPMGSTQWSARRPGGAEARP